MTRETAKQWLLKQRLQNYGYDPKWFGKMSSLKTKLKYKLQYTPDEEVRRSLAQAGVLGKGKRLTKVKGYIKKKGKYVKGGSPQWDYTTGQSFNEELLNMMQLSTSKGKKSFWEVQDKWWEG